MIAVVTVLLAFPLGLGMRSWFAANLTYAVAYLWAFTYQSLYLLLDAIGDSTSPAYEAGEFPLAYGVLTLAVFGVGFGLVALGHRTAARRGERAARAVVR